MPVELSEPVVRKARDARLIRQTLDEIKRANGEGLLVAEEVVEKARNVNNPLHNEFTWDDTVAAQKYRLAQARHLIREIEVTFADDSTETPVPKYVSLMRDRRRKGGGYRETRQVLNNQELLAELEATAKKELEWWASRYKMVKGLVERVQRAAAIQTRQAQRRTRQTAGT